MRNKILLCFFLTGQTVLIGVDYQHVCMFNEKLCIEIPKGWARQDHYSKFSDYEVVFDTRFMARENGSQVTVEITDKKYNPKRISVAARIQAERRSDSLRWRHVFFLESGIETRGRCQVGFIKYQFLLHGKKHYMIESLFSDQDGYMYTVEIYSLILSSGDFKETADHIFKSLKLK